MEGGQWEMLVVGGNENRNGEMSHPEMTKRMAWGSHQDANRRQVAHSNG